MIPIHIYGLYIFRRNNISVKNEMLNVHPCMQKNKLDLVLYVPTVECVIATLQRNDI